MNESTPVTQRSEKSKLITCFLPKGKALDLVRALHDDKGVNTANVTSGRETRGWCAPVVPGRRLKSWM